MSALVHRPALGCGIGALLVALTLAGPARASHCSASIGSDPPGARVYVSGSLIGTTPVTYVSGSETTVSVRLEKKAPIIISISPSMPTAIWPKCSPVSIVASISSPSWSGSSVLPYLPAHDPSP